MIIAQAPMGSARTAFPSSLPERGRNPIGATWMGIDWREPCFASSGGSMMLIDVVLIEATAIRQTRTPLMWQLIDSMINYVKIVKQKEVRMDMICWIKGWTESWTHPRLLSTVFPRAPCSFPEDWPSPTMHRHRSILHFSMRQKVIWRDKGLSWRQFEYQPSNNNNTLEKAWRYCIYLYC